LQCDYSSLDADDPATTYTQYTVHNEVDDTLDNIVHKLTEK